MLWASPAPGPRITTSLAAAWQILSPAVALRLTRYQVNWVQLTLVGMESSKQLSQASCNPWICFDLFFQCSNTWGYTSTTNNEQSFATWHNRGWTKCGKVVGCLVSWFSWKSSRYGTADFGTVFQEIQFTLRAIFSHSPFALQNVDH